MDADRPPHKIPNWTELLKQGDVRTSTRPAPEVKQAPAMRALGREAEPAKTASRTSGALRGESVLLVDDDPVARLLTTAALTERGWRVTEVDSGVKALERFTHEVPAVVLLDAMMPGMDGFTACERLRRLPGGLHVPILMLTGLDDELSIARAYEAGATDFFVKSTNQWTLLSERLRYLLRASRMREELVQSRATLNKAQRIARLGSWEWSRRSRRFKMSEACCAIVGLPYQEEGWTDGYIFSRLYDEDRSRIKVLYRQMLGEGGALDFECRLCRPNADVRVVRIEAEVDRDDAGRARGLRGVMQDVTERRQTEERVRQLANFDTLTGLPNRRCFSEQFEASLEQARAQGQKVAVLFVDLDRFKQVNDTLGHQVGDQILREVALRLTQAMRQNETLMPPSHAGAEPLSDQTRPGVTSGKAKSVGGTLNSVARLGGDEFTVLLTDLSEMDLVERIAEQLLAVLRVPVQVGEHEVFVSGSIGVAVYPADGEDADTLIRKADIAMYAVKGDGRNGWRIFDKAMNTATADRWRIESALHRAIERKELVLEYQPKISVATGEIVGAEALMRWKRDGKMVPPGEFIPIAEESGLIVPITEWAIDTVCDQLRDWQKMNVQVVPISVNISSRHIQRENLVRPIQEALTRTGIAPELLELELTETVLMHNLGAALPLMQSLKQLGISLSIDDFGTGYSSLAYLKRLPIDVLKIDRSFVRDLDSAQSSDGAAIVAAIIAMSKSLKLRVVAEGVETPGQMQRLFEQGCQLMQGWLFAKSLPHDQFLRMLIEHRSDPAWQVQYGQPVSESAQPQAVDCPLAETALVHSNGRRFGVPASQTPQPSAQAASTPDQSAKDPISENAQDTVVSPKDRAKRWANRFLGRMA